MTIQLAHRLFTVDEYYRMAEAGILHEDDRVELLEGEIVEMPPIGSHHASVVDRLTRIFSRAGDAIDATVRVQSPVRLGRTSEPVPDIALLRPRPDFYATAHPVPEDVLLVIEVADTSADSDRDVKLPLYARAGIAEVWIVDLNAGVVDVYTLPSTDGYAGRRSAGRGREVSPGALPQIAVAVSDILG
jgi:Uma2 family endonuclease